MDDPPTNVEPPPEEWSPIRWALSVWTWIFFLAAIAVLEITADPLLASLVLCVKLGGPDLWVGLRLRADSRSPRGVVMAYFCFGLASLKIAGAGVMLTASVVLCAWLLGWQVLWIRFIVGLGLLTTGVFLGMCSIIAASLLTHERNVRPWLDKTLYRRLWEREPLRCDGSRNRVPWLLVAGMIAATGILGCPIAALVVKNLQAPNQMDNLEITVTILGVVWGWMMLQLVRAWWYIANEPAECWGEQPVQSQRDPTAFGP